MNETIEKSFAKLNLALDVLSRRDDGYHELSMIMQSVELHDIITIKKTPKPDISISCNKYYIPTNEANIAYKSAKAFIDLLNERAGVEINIEKKIPVGAGLAGGSANAASVLLGLNKIFGNPFELEKLMELGRSVGADVPFCMAAQMTGGNYCALAEGIGDKLTQIPNLTDVVYLLVKPKISVSTRWVYENLDVTKISRHPDIEKVVEGLALGDISLVSQNTANVLEGVVLARYPMIEKLKNEMRNSGAKFSLMSGSGSTVFGVFDDRRRAYKAYEYFEKSQKFVWMS